MTTNETKAAFETVATAARLRMDHLEKRREKLQRELDSIQVEMIRVRGVLDFTGEAPSVPAAQPAQPVQRERKIEQGVWPNRIEELLKMRGHRVQELHEALRITHAFRHPLKYLQKLLDSAARRDRFYCDDERYWRVKLNANSAAGQLAGYPRPTGTPLTQ
jgi:hypothetical protein